MKKWLTHGILGHSVAYWSKQVRITTKQDLYQNRNWAKRVREPNDIKIANKYLL